MRVRALKGEGERGGEEKKKTHGGRESENLHIYVAERDGLCGLVITPTAGGTSARRRKTAILVPGAGECSDHRPAAGPAAAGSAFVARAVLLHVVALVQGSIW